MNNFGLGLILNLTDNATSGLRSATGAFNELNSVTANFSSANNAQEAFAQIAMGARILGDDLYAVGNRITSFFTGVVSKINETGTTILSARSQLSTLYGDDVAGANKLEEIKDYAAHSIFNFEDLIPSVIMLKANGIEAFDQIATSAYRASDGVEGYSQTLMDYASDLAAFNPQMHNVYGTGVQAAIGALNEYIAEGNAMSLKRGASLDITALLGEEKGKTIEERSRQVADLVEQLGMVGMTVSLANTPMQRLSNLGDLVFNTMTKIADFGVFDKYSEIVSRVSDYLMETIDEEEWTNLAKIIGDALTDILDLLNPVVDVMIKVIDKVRELINTNPELVKTIIKYTAFAGVLFLVSGVALKVMSSLGFLRMSITSLFKGMSLSKGGYLISLLKNFAKYLAPVTAGIILFKEAWSRDFMGMREGISEGIKKAWESIKLIFDAFTDNTLSAEGFQKAQEMGILPLIEAILQLKYHWEFFIEGFKKGVDAFFESLSTILVASGILDTKVSSLGELFTALAEKMTAPGMTETWEKVGFFIGKITPALLMIIAVAPTLINLFVGVFNAIKVVAGVASFLFKLFGGLKTVIMSVLAIIGNVVIAILAGFGIIVTLPAELVGLIVAAVVALVVIIVKYWDEICAFLKESWGYVCEYWSKWIDSICNFFKESWGYVTDFWSGVWQSVTSFIVTAFTTVVTFLKTKIDQIVEFATKVKNTFSQAWSAIGDKFSEIFNGIAEWFDSFIGGIQKAFNTVKGWFGGGTVSVSVSGSDDQQNSDQMVGLATGGYVKTTGIAVLHPNEVVVNDDLTKGLATFLSEYESVRGETTLEPLTPSYHSSTQNYADSHNSYLTQNDYLTRNNYSTRNSYLTTNSYSDSHNKSYDSHNSSVSDAHNSYLESLTNNSYSNNYKDSHNRYSDAHNSYLESLSNSNTQNSYMESINNSNSNNKYLESLSNSDSHNSYLSTMSNMDSHNNYLHSLSNSDSHNSYVESLSKSNSYDYSKSLSRDSHNSYLSSLTDSHNSEESINNSNLYNSYMESLTKSDSHNSYVESLSRDAYNYADSHNSYSDAQNSIMSDNRKSYTSPVSNYLSSANNTTNIHEGNITNTSPQDNRVVFERGSIIFNVDKNTDMSDDGLNQMAEKLMKIMSRKLQLRSIQTRV